MEQKDLPFSTLFIELDALLDTRLATAANLGDDVLQKVLECDYHNRPIDEFPGIDNKTFKTRYAGRTKEILAHALITPMGLLIREFSEKTLQQVKSTPFHFRPKVVINIHPYQLDETEITNIIAGVRGVTKGLCDIETVNMTYEEITPSFVKQHLSVIVLYEYYRWLEVHSQNGFLKKITCPEVTMFGPAIYFKPVEQEVPPGINPFESMEFLARPFIGLKLIPIENFSMVFKRSQKNK